MCLLIFSLQVTSAIRFQCCSGLKKKAIKEEQKRLETQRQDTLKYAQEQLGKVYTEVRQSPRENVTTPCQYRVNGFVPVSTVGLQVFSLNLFLIVIL